MYVCVCVSVCVCVYLWVCQAGVVGFEVVDDALCGSRQSGTAHQQHKQHDIWEGGCQVHHLQCTQRAGGCGQDGTDTEKTGGGHARAVLKHSRKCWKVGVLKPADGCWRRHNKQTLITDFSVLSLVSVTRHMKEEDLCSLSNSATTLGFVASKQTLCH